MLKQLVLSLMMICAVAPLSQWAHADALGTADVRIIEDKLRVFDGKDALKASTLLNEASDAVAKMAPDVKKPLDPLQVRELVELLKLTNKIDTYNKVIDNNADLFVANDKAIREELKRLPPKESKDIILNIDAVERSLNGSDESDDLEKAKPAAKPSVSEKKSAIKKK